MNYKKLTNFRTIKMYLYDYKMRLIQLSPQVF